MKILLHSEVIGVVGGNQAWCRCYISSSEEPRLQILGLKSSRECKNACCALLGREEMAVVAEYLPEHGEKQISICTSADCLCDTQFALTTLIGSVVGLAAGMYWVGWRQSK